jgi:pimeloyl-ACP methyl ester carboxylesterase
LISLSLPVLLVGAWSAGQRARDPLEALRREELDWRVLRDSSYEGVTGGGERRVFRDLAVATGPAGTIRVTTSRPAEAVPHPLPLVFILAGLRTGRDALAVVDVHGPNLLVGYEYPYSQETWYESAKLDQLPAIRKAVLDVPAQVVRMAAWLAMDRSVDRARTSLLGYSFGAMFVPAVQRLAEAQGTPFHGLVLAYGGADIQSLLDHNINLRYRSLRRLLAWLGATVLHPMEAEHHLPHVSGRFLLIRGELDQKIPLLLSTRLADLTPEPKKIVSLPESHLGPSNPELTARVVRISLAWLIEEGLIRWSGAVPVA